MENNMDIEFPPLDFNMDNNHFNFTYNSPTTYLQDTMKDKYPFPSNTILPANNKKPNILDLNISNNNLDQALGASKPCPITKTESLTNLTDSPNLKEQTEISSKSQRKRTRANAEQLAILEEAFIQNSSPNSKARELLAEKVNMTERSVQIWFQNRRAKVKLMQKRSYMMQEEAIRHQMYNGCYMPNMSYSSPFASQYNPTFPIINHAVDLNTMSPNLSSGSLTYPPNPHSIKTHVQPRSLSLGTQQTPFLDPSKPNEGGIIGSIRCDVISIGSWRRRCVHENDLMCFYNLSQRVLTWQVADSGMKFKMDIPFSAIASVVLTPNQTDSTQGTLIFDTNQIPNFFLEQNFHGQTVWTPCRDFTENAQASRFFKHGLHGSVDTLAQDLLALTNKDINIRNIAKFPDELDMTRIKNEMTIKGDISMPMNINIPSYDNINKPIYYETNEHVPNFPLPK